MHLKSCLLRDAKMLQPEGGGDGPQGRRATTRCQDAGARAGAGAGATEQKWPRQGPPGAQNTGEEP
eukprot:505492-Karenia_brevis.AAC.2